MSASNINIELDREYSNLKHQVNMSPWLLHVPRQKQTGDLQNKITPLVIMQRVSCKEHVL